MKASRCFTGSYKGHQAPALNKAAYFQLIKMCREANNETNKYKGGEANDKQDRN